MPENESQRKKSGLRPEPEDILELFQRPGYSPMTANEISKEMALRGKGRKKIQKVLHQMILDGRIVMIRKNRYSFGEPADLVSGRLEVRRSGDGFLASATGPADVFIPKDNLGTALPGDLVTARFDTRAPRRADQKRVAKVIRVLERGKKLIVGTLKSTGRFYYVVPLDPAYDQDFYVSDPVGAAVGDRVVIQFTAWENRHVNPEAEIVDVIGPAENPSLDTLATIRQFGLHDIFPPEVLEEATEAAAFMDDPGERLDLRDKLILTIDPATAKDFDDALSLDINPDGQRVLGVHIADVSHFVRRGSALDKEAAMRGNSVYLPDKVLPMLPEQLSNGVCSLKPGQDRLTFSVFITLTADGNVTAHRFARSVIRSRFRLTYEQVLASIKPEQDGLTADSAISAEALELLRNLNDLAQQLRGRRFSRYALDLDLPENEVMIGKDGMISGIRALHSDISHQLVEECMVAANEVVDGHLSNRGYGILHRVHDPPSPERIAALTEDLIQMGYRPGDLKQRRHLAEFLKSIRTDPLAYDVQIAVLRSMKRAVYTPELRGHYGLAKKYYSHFTSPIRRYPDLIAHRALACALVSAPSPYHGDELAALGVQCSWTEQTADDAERFLVEIKKFRFLEQQLQSRKPVVYDAVVVNVRNFGMFVELLELQVQGLVHVSTISDRFVQFDSLRQTLRAGNETYGVRTRVRVRVTRVEFDRRRLDFALVREGEGEARPPKRQERRAVHAPHSD